MAKSQKKRINLYLEKDIADKISKKANESNLTDSAVARLIITQNIDTPIQL